MLSFEVIKNICTVIPSQIISQYLKPNIYHILIFAGGIFLFSSLYTESSIAQTFDEPDMPARVQGGIGIIGGFPVGEFGDQVTDPGGGLNGHLGYYIPESPVIIGLDVAYLIYGHERRRERFSLTIPDVNVNVVTDNSILMSNLFLRLQPRDGVFRPYIDGLIGFHYLFTKTSIQDIPNIFEDDIASSINFDDTAFT